MAPVRLPPASSVLATLTLPSSKALAAQFARPPVRTPAPALAGIEHYRILRTNEVDPKDAPLTPEERATIMATGEAALRSFGDDFAGTARKAAKLSISDAPAETIGALVSPSAP